MRASQSTTGAIASLQSRYNLGHRLEVGAVILAAVAGCAVGLAALFGLATPLNGVLIVIALGAVLIIANLSIRNPSVASVLLLAVSFVFMRPMLFGERYSPVSIALAAAALVCAAIAGNNARERSSGSVVLWVSLLWLWNLLLVLQPGVSLENTLRGAADVPLVMGAAWVVTSDRNRRALLVKLIVGMVLVTCASFVITFALWELKGFDAFQLATIPGGYKQDIFGADLPGVPLFAPLTTTYGVVQAGAAVIPRFLGLGRESGIMGAVIAWCYFMLPRIGWNQLWVKVLLILGLAGTQSTAAFGTFLVVFILTRFFVGQRPLSPSLTALRGLLGVAALVAASYLAIYAPVLGVLFKFESNSASVNDRVQAASNGLLSALEHPLGQAGGAAIGPNAGINILGALLITGLPGLIFSLGALVRPFMLSREPRAALGPTAVVLITCLTAQPLSESTAFFLLVMLGCASYGSVASEASTDWIRVGPTGADATAGTHVPRGLRGAGAPMPHSAADPRATRQQAGFRTGQL